MKTIFGLIAATGILATSAAPLFAATVIGDPMTTSCSDYLKQNDTDRLSLAMQYDAYQAMSEADKTAVEAMTDEQKATMIADARTKRAAMNATDLEALTTTADNWKVKMDNKCQADGGKMVVEVMETGM
jgi:hypothetical protein